MSLRCLSRLLPPLWPGLLLAALLACARPALAGTGADPNDPLDHGAYLSLVFGNGRITGGNASGDTWMHGRTFEVRAGRRQELPFGASRIDFVHYNEGHPDNNHRDGFALQWLAVRQLNANFTGELGLGPYLSMNTTVIDGRQLDDTHWGLLLSAALRLELPWVAPGAHLRLGYNHAQMTRVHRSDALMLGIGRQFGRATPDPATEPETGPLWLGASVGNSITNMAGTHGATAAVVEARRYLDKRLEHWAASVKYLREGDDGVRVDRRGVAGQLWYVQQVTPRFAMSAGLGPYLARNLREETDGVGGRTRTNLLISFQAERALSRRTRVFLSFNRVKTFRETDDRDLFLLGALGAF